MRFIYIEPADDIADSILDALESCVARTFALPVRRMRPFADPFQAYDAQRRQYGSTEILRLLRGRLPVDALRVLGVVDRDIFIPMLTFIFGQAQLGGSLAIISLTRLRQEFYGLPPDGALFLERICKEATHELGHTFGLTHCLDPRCAMSLATSIEHVDTKSSAFCASCRRLVRDHIGSHTSRSAGGRDAREEKR